MLKKIREEKGMSQSQLANLSGVSVRAIKMYEQGERNINKAAAETVYKLSVALECEMENIIEKERE